MDPATTVVSGIKCKKCCCELPPMTMKDHLDGKFNKECPHEDKFWVDFKVDSGQIWYTFQVCSWTKNRWAKLKMIHKKRLTIDGDNISWTSYYPTEDEKNSESSYYGKTWTGRMIKGYMHFLWDGEMIDLEPGSSEVVPHICRDCHSECEYYSSHPMVCKDCYRERLSWDKDVIVIEYE